MVVLTLLLLLISCGQGQPSVLNEAINIGNDPTRIPGGGHELITQINDLPKAAAISRVWTGWWWPMSEGGTASTRYDRISPMAKYDLATYNNGRATEWEKAASQRSAHVAWAGHCNGIAAAGVMMEEPIRPVKYNNIIFQVEDIKALLAELWQGSGYIVGERCTEAITYDAYGRIKKSACRDLNPATFHLGVTNFLGVFGKAIIFDIDPLSAVWNYPIFSYKIIKEDWLTKNAALSILNRRQDSYIYNDLAMDFVLVTMQAEYKTAGQRVYKYILELDHLGNIIGGEWLPNQATHPDFIWRPNDPKPDNPYLDVNVIMEIYKNAI